RAALDRLNHLKPAGIGPGGPPALPATAAPGQAAPAANAVLPGQGHEGTRPNGANSQEPAPVTPPSPRPAFRAWPPRDDYNWPRAAAAEPHAVPADDNHHVGRVESDHSEADSSEPEKWPSGAMLGAEDYENAPALASQPEAAGPEDDMREQVRRTVDAAR